MNLSAFASARASIEVAMPDGTTASARVLTMADDRAIAEILPRPVPPKKKPDDKGSKAPAEMDPTDAGYNQRFDEWTDLIGLCQVAVALDVKTFEHDTGWSVDASKADRLAWWNRVKTTLMNTVSSDWVEHTLRTVRRAGLGELIAEAGQGNSGSSTDN